ncbi:MAG: DUF3343 domain-containing protein [Bacillota bacterium]|jgi:hypothetical protein
MLKNLFTGKKNKEQTKSIIITFHTTYDTMNLNDHFNKAAIKGRLIPVPRSLSASCGIAWQGDTADEEIIKAQINKDKLEIESFNIM